MMLFRIFLCKLMVRCVLGLGSPLIQARAEFLQLRLATTTRANLSMANIKDELLALPGARMHVVEQATAFFLNSSDWSPILELQKTVWHIVR